jgi:DNA-binding CsgD family transcriptional regulator
MSAGRGALQPRAERVLDAIDANIAVLDSNGLIISTNKGWRDFAADNRLADGSLPRHVEVGANYLDVCSAADGESSDNAKLVFDGIKAVLEGKKKTFSHEYPCHSADKQRWFLMKVKALARSRPREVVVIHIDITTRYLAELQLRNKQQELNGALLQLHELAERIKDSLGLQSFSLPPNALINLQQNNQAQSDLLKSLSARELEVLSGLVRGERNSAIATRLQLSRKSVSTYRSRVFDKLKVESNAQLVALISKHDRAVPAR